MSAIQKSVSTADTISAAEFSAAESVLAAIQSVQVEGAKKPDLQSMANPSSDAVGYVHGVSQTEQSRLLEQGELLRPVVYSAEIAKILESHSSRVVELGSGSGTNMVYVLSQYVGIRRYTAVDFNQDAYRGQLEKTFQNELSSKRLSLEQADIQQPCAEHLKGEAGTVFFTWVLEHLKEPKKGIQYAADCLQPGGCLIGFECDWHVAGIVTSDAQLNQQYAGFVQSFCAKQQGSGNPHYGQCFEQDVRESGLFTEIQSQKIQLESSMQFANMLLNILSGALLESKEEIEAYRQKLLDVFVSTHVEVTRIVAKK